MKETVTKAGLAAGPCLIHSMQLKYFTKNNFELGFAAMKINEHTDINEKKKKN